MRCGILVIYKHRESKVVTRKIFFGYAVHL